MGYWNKFWKNGNEPTNEAEQRTDRVPSHSNGRYSTTSLSLRSGVSKPLRTSQRLTKATSAMKPKRFIDLCQAVVDAAHDLGTPVGSEDPYTGVVNQRMGEIYQDIHATSATRENDVTSKLVPQWSLEDIVEDRPEGSTHWVGSRLLLDRAARNQVIGYALTWHTVPHNTIYNDLQTAIERVSTTPADTYRESKKLVFFERRRCRRYGEFVTRNGWMMLSILANSASFRNDARQLDEHLWSLLCECIADNFNSLEIFAKARELDWKTALTKREEYEFLISENLGERVPPDTVLSPHGCIVPEAFDGLERTMDGTRPRIDIRNNYFHHSVFFQVSMPVEWPHDIPYPSDPTIAKAPQSCEICQLNSCSCEPHSCDYVTQPLVELRRYYRKGVGIRALQQIHQDDVLAEYVGQIVPKNTRDQRYMDYVYAFLFTRPGHSEPFALISSKYMGNWTRYMSHSCQANTKFVTVAIGGRYRVMVVAERDIEIFEEVTVDYGDDYFKSQQECFCGEPRCRFQDDPDVMHG